jgi:hypothetical protein
MAPVAPDGTEIRSLVLWTGVNIFGSQQIGKCQFGGFVIV